MKRLLLISPWFGAWPEWINFFIESCKHNREIDWLIPTDQAEPENKAPNVKFVHYSFDDYREKLSSEVGVDLHNLTPYKLCDLKPFLGLIFSTQLEGYKSFGYCDNDIVFGDLRAIYTDDILDRYEAISSHSDRMAGHLSVFRNTPKMQTIAKRIPNWRERIAAVEHFGLDEGALTTMMVPRRKHVIKRLLAPTSLLVERYTTPGGGERLWPDGLQSPDAWTWKNGQLSNERFSSGILYLHFMFWHSSRWRRPHTGAAPWLSLHKIVQCDWREAAQKGFSISPHGIRLLA